jgi:hypothetical protein
MVTVLPLTLQTDGEALANVTGLVDAPPVADTVNVPFGAKTGAAGLATKYVIACVADPITTVSDTCGAAL